MKIMDAAGVLAPGAAKRLEAVGYNFDPTIVILKKSPDNLSDYIHQLPLGNESLNMVIDIPGRQVRTMVGSNLTDAGVDGSYLKRMQDTVFVPRMKKKDLEGAIGDSLTFVQAKLSVSDNSEELLAPAPQQTTPVVVVQQQAPTQTNINVDPILSGTMFVVVVVALAIYCYKRFSLSFKIQERMDAFKEESDALVALSLVLEGEAAANDWYVRLKMLGDDFSTFKVSRADASDKLVTISRLCDRAAKLRFEGESLRNSMKAPRTVMPAAAAPVKRMSTPSTVVQQNQNVQVSNTNFYNSLYTRTMREREDEEPKKKEEKKTRSDSGSSSYGSSSSRSSSSSRKSSSSDSGSSSWGSSSSSDSGSSSWGGGSSDSGSSGW